MTGPVTAVVFDFDGTIIDTETPVFESMHQLFVEYDAEPVTREEFIAGIGLSTDALDDPYDTLGALVGPTFIRADAVARRRAVMADMVAAQPLRPGVMEWIDACRTAGVALAVASSSPIAWVDHHLRERGLLECFATLSCAGDGAPGKPDPFVYARACADIGVEPGDAVAIEDSPPGVASAKAAGLRCIAAPGPMTASLDLSAADVGVSSLADLAPADWL